MEGKGKIKIGRARRERRKEDERRGRKEERVWKEKKTAGQGKGGY